MPIDDRPAPLAAFLLLLAVTLSSCATRPPSPLALEIQENSARIEQQQRELKRQREQSQRDWAAQREVPTDAGLAAADCGPPPLPGWRAVLESALRASLRDPDSGVFRFAEPEKVGTKAGEGAPFEFLWKVYYEVNARNGFGGYTGFQSGAVYFKDGERISIEEHLERQRAWRAHRDQG
jgi:hypothetical protein